MKILNTILLIIVAAEAMAAGYFVILSKDIVPLPELNVATLEPGMADQFRAFRGNLDLGDPESWLRLGLVYRALGMLPESSYCYQQFDRLSPNNPEGLYYWGVCLSRMGNTRAAAAKFEQAIALESEKSVTCWYMLGRDHLRDGNGRMAELALRRCAHEEPQATIMLTRLLTRTGKADEVQPLISNLVKQQPTNMVANQWKSWAEEALGNHEVAEHFEHMTRRCPAPPSNQRPELPADENVYRQFGGSRLATEGVRAVADGDTALGIDLLRQALTVQWREIYAIRLAELELTAGDHEAAVATLSDIVERAGASAESLYLLGQAHQQLEDRQAARQHWERAATFPASRNPEVSAKIHEVLADTYRESGEQELASRQEGLMHYERGKLAWRVSDFSIALDEFANAAELLDDHAHTWYYLAEARHASQDEPGAREAYARCLAINPNHGRAIRRLAALASPPEEEP